jgi:release factor glutamine methyltransferase
MNEAELLFSEILNCSRTDLYLNKDLMPDFALASFVSRALKRRLSREPIQYILGKTEFMGLEFKVNKNVFIPRPETELLVETAIRAGYPVSQLSSYPVIQLSSYPVIQLSSYPVKILDLGTGSGCVAISLAKFLPGAKVTALDISDKALEVAKENARLNDAEVEFLKRDLTGNWQLASGSFDIMVSNPPYIPSAEIDNLQPEVRHEPRLALDGGKDGLDFYRRIIPQVRHYLKKGGCLVMEMGFGQKDAIKDIVGASGIFKTSKIIKDYSGIDRIIVARREERDGRNSS